MAENQENVPHNNAGLEQAERRKQQQKQQQRDRRKAAQRLESLKEKPKPPTRKELLTWNIRSNVGTGTVHKSLKSLRMKVGAACEKLGITPFTSGSNSTDFRARFPKTKCVFEVKASYRFKQNDWIVNSFVIPQKGHTDEDVEQIAGDNSNRTGKNCGYKYNELAPCLYAIIRGSKGDDTLLRWTALKVVLNDYVRYVDKAAVVKIREEARKDIYGDPDITPFLWSNLINELKCYGHKVMYKTIDRDEMKQWLIEDAKEKEGARNFDEQTFLERDAVKLASLLGPVQDQREFVKDVFFIPKYALNKVECTKLIWGVDGAHTCSPGTIYQAYTLDANDHLYLLGFAVMAQNESKDSWQRFFAFLKEHLPYLNDSLRTLISDGLKGIAHGFHEEFPQSWQFRCANHRCDNLVKADKTIQGPYRKATKAYTREKVREALQEISNQASLSKIKNLVGQGEEDTERSYATQFPAFRMFHEDGSPTGANMYGRTSQQFVESANAADIVPRNKRTLFDVFRCLLDQQQKRWEENGANARNHDLRPTPKAVTFLNRCEEVARQKEMTVTNVEDTVDFYEATVSHEGKSYFTEVPINGESKFERSRCTCNYSALMGKPCWHMVYLYRVHRNRVLADLTPTSYLGSTWKLQYPADDRHSFKVPTMQSIQSTPVNRQLGQVMVAKKKTGRPAICKRKPSSRERRFMTCGGCGKKEGHNKRSCPNPESPNPESQEDKNEEASQNHDQQEGEEEEDEDEEASQYHEQQEIEEEEDEDEEAKQRQEHNEYRLYLTQYHDQQEREEEEHEDEDEEAPQWQDSQSLLQEIEADRQEGEEQERSFFESTIWPVLREGGWVFIRGIYRSPDRTLEFDLNGMIKYANENHEKLCQDVMAKRAEREEDEEDEDEEALHEQVQQHPQQQAEEQGTPPQVQQQVQQQQQMDAGATARVTTADITYPSSSSTAAAAPKRRSNRLAERSEREQEQENRDSNANKPRAPKKAGRLKRQKIRY